MLDIDFSKVSGPAFFYDFRLLSKRYDLVCDYLKSTFPKGEKFFYSVKSNPNPSLIKELNHFVDGFDISSGLEGEMLKHLGVEGAKISFSGPGKSDKSLMWAKEQSLNCIHIDSLSELQFLRELGSKSPKSLRLNLHEATSKLGFLEEEIVLVLESSEKGEFCGLHSYLGKEKFNLKSCQTILNKMEELIERFSANFTDSPKLFLGPGLPSEESQWEKGLVKSNIPIQFEFGRGFVGKLGYYYCPVLAVKEADPNVIIVDGGVHHLASPIMKLMKGGERWCYWVRDDGKAQEMPADKMGVLYGSLCLSHDCLHPRFTYPEDLKRGDALLIEECGAYGLTAGMPFFIGQNLPREFAIVDQDSRNAKIIDVTPGFVAYHDAFDIEKVLSCPI